MSKHGLVNQCAVLWHRFYYGNFVSFRYQLKLGMGLYQLDALSKNKQYIEVDIGPINIVIFL